MGGPYIDLRDHTIPVPYKVSGGPSDHTYGGTICTCEWDHMIPVPYKVREHEMPIPYKVLGTIRVIDSYNIPTVDSNHEDTSH